MLPRRTLGRVRGRPKERFNEVITQQQEIRCATLICEEIEHGCDAIARDLAERRDARYANADIPVGEREIRGIPPGYAEPGAAYALEQIERWHSIREQFMVERLLAEQQEKGEPTLFICGRFHRERLAVILRACGVEVEVIDLAGFEWFSDTWELDY